MNNNQVIGVLLVASSLFLLFSDKIKIPGPEPSNPVNQQLVQEIKSVMVGPNASDDAQNLGRCMLACANLFALDSQRETPYYQNTESMKWAIKNVGDLSYPLGWKMSDKYPTLPTKLGGWLESQVGSEVNNVKLIEKMRELGYALMEV